MNVVEAFQESAALLVPGAHKSVRFLHHCSNDLARNRVVGVCGLKRFAPFKELNVEGLVLPFHPPSGRVNLKVPDIDDFSKATTTEEFSALVGTSDTKVSALKERSGSLWVHPSLLVHYYSKASKAADIALLLISKAPEDDNDDDDETLMASILDQLIFLWSIEKGYVSITTLRDPPESDELQKKIEETNDLILADQPERFSGPNGQDHDMDRDGQGDGRSTGMTTPRRGTLTDGPPRRSRSKSRRRSRERRRGSPTGSSPSPSRSGRRSRSRSRSRRRRSSDSRRSTTRERSRSESRQPQVPGDRDEALVTAIIQGVTALTRGQLEASERERKKSSVLSRLSRRQTFLFDALSASDWRDKNPKRTKEADMILEDRDVERNWNLLIDLTEKWPGGVSKPAFIQFLTKGFISQERPGGFTAFMFSPPRKNKQGKKDRKRNLRNVLGKSSEVDEEDLEYYAKNDFYIPKSVYEGEVQIQMAVRTLDLLTNHKSIASDGYRYGLEFLDGRRNTFHEEQEKDEMFMARYVNLLDTAFQNFSSELASFHTDRDPIRTARSSLRGKMSDDIKRIMRDIDYDVMPNLPLPPRLTEQDRNTGGGKKGKTKDHREKDQESDTERQDNPSWWKKNPSPLSEWALPSGAKFQDHFDPGSAKGRVNLARLPRVKHHNTKIKLKRNLCAKYQSMGECKPGCNLAHILPSKLPEDAKKEADLAFKEAYS